MKRGALPLNALRAFEATMRHGQMQLAAAELGVTYGAISRQVRSLEDRLGVVLFEGPRNRLVPTALARDLHPPLQSAFDAIETVVRQVTKPKRQSVLVSCLSTFAMRWLIPRLFDFQQSFPEIDIRLTADDADVDFTRDDYDLAIRVGQGPGAHDTCTVLFADSVGPVLSPDLARSRGAFGPETVSDYPILHTKTRRTAWPDWCASQGWTVPVGGREFEHFYFLTEAVTAGLGAAIVPEVLVQHDLVAGRLSAPFGFVPSGMDYVALTPRAPSEPTQRFVQWLEKQARMGDAMSDKGAAS